MRGEKLVTGYVDPYHSKHDTADEYKDLDKKTAEGRAYLRKLQEKVERDNVAKVKKSVREPLEKDIELSQISAWTGESVMNINKGGKGQAGALYKGVKLTKA